MGDIRKTLYAAQERTGLARSTLHDMRRSFAKFAADNGTDDKTIMEFTGHKTDAMLRRYRIVNTATQDAAQGKLAAKADEIVGKNRRRKRSAPK